MSGIEATVPMVAPTAEIGFFRKHGQDLLKVVAAGVGAIGMSAIVGGGEADAAPVHPHIPANIVQDCNNFDTQAHAAANGKHYQPAAFLPEGRIQSTPQGYQADQKLFTKGPLGTGNSDPASLAAVYSAITEPAQKGNSVADYNYKSAFDRALGQFNSNGNAAIGACEVTYETMLETERYNDSWAQPGQTVTLLTPMRDPKTNQVTGEEVQHITLGQTLKGEEFSDAPLAHHKIKGVKGFNSVLRQDGTGYLYVQGQAPIKVPENGSSSKQQAKGTGGGGSKAGKASPQSNPGPGSAENPIPGQQPVQPGAPHPTPGGGGGGTTTTTGPGHNHPPVTTTTTPEQTTTTTTPEQTTTTTTQPNTTTTTAPSKGAAPPQPVCNQYEPCTNPNSAMYVNW
jgi:hypothetical protein